MQTFISTYIFLAPVRMLLAGNVKGMLEAMEQEETLCDEEETVREFTYLGDRVSEGGGCEAATTR